ncbi:MAG: hypothetical protein J7K80_00845, partial [Candidatus Izimaplasma sp.]|nr:hypothetical protein [Candidatus Izimaplasma bacterium]
KYSGDKVYLTDNFSQIRDEKNNEINADFITYKNNEIINNDIESRLEKTIEELEHLKTIIVEKDFIDKKKKDVAIDTNKLSGEVLKQFNLKFKREKQRKGLV